MRVKRSAYIRSMAPKKRITKQEKHKAKLASMPKPQFKNLPLEQLVWKEPTTTEKHLEKLAAEGLLPEKAVGGWRVLTSHQTPGKNEGEVVLFRSFIQWGLGLPASDFLRGLLHYYGLTLNHLTPNAVLHTSIFVHLCEAYLGICPSFTLFHHFL
jgi:hypothetical protein